MKLPDWFAIAQAPASPVRVALLCACSYFRNRHRRQTRASRSRKAVGGRVEESAGESWRTARRMVRLFIEDARQAMKGGRP